MLLRKWMIVLMLMIAVVVSGCTAEANNDEPVSLGLLYPGEIEHVDRMEVMSGSTGEKKMYDDAEQVQSWLKSIEDIELIVSPDQSKKDGFLYSVLLFEGDKKTMGFTPNLIDGKYYETDERVVEAIEVLFEKQ
ncbi:hypothetical protein [Paenibacillus harenae]|uniref:Zn-ribbon and HTH transcriptional regulator n=1 Tax=Paenibacillus harenae TaxID=306543 RepID=A0ABT9U035_PAEHA|nr:hypothetical protein [Paenibacillus harenae]MDQ0112466.1 putative Zn-ribbon and HTH transcriptional regulator [Paenibacillus harenae]